MRPDKNYDINHISMLQLPVVIRFPISTWKSYYNLIKFGPIIILAYIFHQ